LQGIDIGRRVYWMRGWQRALFLVLGLTIGGLGVLVAVATKGPAQDGPPLLVALLPFVACIYFLAMALRSRLIIDGSHIEVRGAFREQSAELSDIEGYRTISTRNGSFWRLQLRQGRGSITVQKSFDCDEVRAWFQRLTDLDERDRNALLDEIRQAQELGATPDERLNALKQAKQLNIALSAVVIAAAVAFFFSEGGMRLIAAIVLALTPAVVLYLLNRDPLLYAVGGPKRDPRTDLTIAVLVSGIGLMMGGVLVHFVSYKPLMEWGALVAAAYIFAFSTFTQKGPRVPGFLLIMLIYGGLYGYGFVSVADTLLDHAPATAYATSVIGEHEVHGKSTSYILDLAPWGPFDKANKLSVPLSEYRRARVGDPVCLSLHPGYLRASWYTRVPCGVRFDAGLK
jgi:hypothetical protein